MVNTGLLEQKIKDSGKTKEHLAEILGMTTRSLNNKLNGRSQFTGNEMYTLCEDLHIEDPVEKVSIFLA